jgi:hypothetical protein
MLLEVTLHSFLTKRNNPPGQQIEETGFAGPYIIAKGWQDWAFSLR